MSSLAANFLWGGRSSQTKIHLVKMQDITRPRKDGGWGLLNLEAFGKGLLCKSLHRGIFGSGPWSLLINRKYLKGKGIVFWYRRKILGKKRGSAIWLGFRKLHQFFLENLQWKISTGASILIGIDNILNGPSSFPPPILYLQNKGIFTWDKLIFSWSNSTPVWKSASDLLLSPPSPQSGPHSFMAFRLCPFTRLFLWTRWYGPSLPSPSPSQSNPFMLLSLPPP